MITKILGLPENASEHGIMIDHMMELVHWFMLALFLGWSAFFLFTLWRFRKSKNPQADYVGVRSKFSSHAEVGVIIVEGILLLGFAFPLWSKRVNAPPGPEQNPVIVRAVGQQYLWNLHYPGQDGIFGRRSIDLVDAGNPLGLDRSDEAAQDDFVALNSLYLPVNRPAIIQISSKDVIHNFGLYAMRIAQDAIPGSEVPIWFTPKKTGEWEVICGQLCGAGHALMKAYVTVVSPEEYNAWLKQRAPRKTACASKASDERIAAEHIASTGEGS